MIQTLFSEIRSFLDKDFLFASLLPTIVFLASIGATVGGVLGFEGALAWIESWTGTQQVMVSLVLFIGIIIFAYCISGLRVAFLSLWSGLVSGHLRVFFLWGEARSRKMFDAEFDKTHISLTWQPFFESLMVRLQGVWGKNDSDPSKDIPPELYKELQNQLDPLKKSKDSKIAAQLLEESFIPLYKKYYQDKQMGVVYSEVLKFLEQKIGEEQANIRRRFLLDRQFGPRETIRGTRLGNVVESFYAYPYSRYGMEGEVMWPHLQTVIEEKLLKRILDVKIVLDFCLAMATLGMLYGVLAIIGGPWLWFNLTFWSAIALAAVLVSYAVYYRLGVLVAIQYGDLVRASFDLFRGDLALKLVARSEEEVAKWEKISRLLAYGQGEDQTPQRIEGNDQKEDQSQPSISKEIESFWEKFSKRFRRHPVS